jgi:hypothetical protein
MPAERIAMRQVRDVLRLKAAGVAINEIARRVCVASSTVRLTLKRLAAAGLCQIACNCDPLFASNRDPSPALVQACPGSEQEGPARSGVTATSPT